MFIFFILDECCVHIEVYYETKNEAYENQFQVYGTYTKLSETVNGHSHYQSDFDGGGFGIWWCYDDYMSLSYWTISDTIDLGECLGYVGSISGILEKCVHNVGWNWEYVDEYSNAWMEAGEGLGIRCIGMH